MAGKPARPSSDSIDQPGRNQSNVEIDVENPTSPSAEGILTIETEPRNTPVAGSTYTDLMPVTPPVACDARASISTQPFRATVASTRISENVP